MNAIESQKRAEEFLAWYRVVTRCEDPIVLVPSFVLTAFLNGDIVRLHEMKPDVFMFTVIYKSL